MTIEKFIRFYVIATYSGCFRPANLNSLHAFPEVEVFKVAISVYTTAIELESLFSCFIYFLNNIYLLTKTECRSKI